jgi:preprotein translocase subunit SecE
LGVRVPPALQVVLKRSFKKFYEVINQMKDRLEGTTMTESTEQVAEKLSLFARVGLFYRQIISELSKVVWPSRKQLSTYTAVVLVFVTFVIAVVSIFDLVITKLVFWVFG